MHAYSPIVSLLVSLIICSLAQATNTPPNVILILADDMAVGDFASANGGQSETPRLDQLAGQSVWFHQAYSASCVCAPARAAMLTGRYPHRTGVVTLNVTKYPELTRLRDDEITIAEVLKANGYSTGLIGKWHCGEGKGHTPLAHGFDEFEGFCGTPGPSYFQYHLQVGEEKTLVDGKYLTEDITERAIQFVRRHRNEPFLLHLAHYAPHRPLNAPENIVAKYGARGFSTSTATIYAMIEIMDRGIGELLDELDHLGIADNTIVIFASDNGPDPLTGQRWNHDLQGMKYEVYEGGIRVPLMVRWPKKLSPKKVSGVVHFVDLFPTIIDLAGIEYRPAQPLDGHSVADVLTGSSKAADFSPPRFWQWNRGVPNYTHNAAMRDGDWKLVRPYVTRAFNPIDSRRTPLLFNLADDPEEHHNVADQHVDRVIQMNRAISEWSQSIEADRLRAKPTSDAASGR